ncbi:Twitchin [Fragariocoptes setiger]|uniref:Twitchin n=1 Tax=Fragariocoptes setiger TaxID=1670756 RepID=A0ABQ7S898_9ACAR|nr:Twitchin [Fragariocoptes setiger]
MSWLASRGASGDGGRTGASADNRDRDRDKDSNKLMSSASNLLSPRHAPINPTTTAPNATRLPPTTTTKMSSSEIEGLAPTFQKKPSISQHDNGQRLVFECRVCAHPEPDVKWYHNGQQLAAAARHKLSVTPDNTLGANTFVAQLQVTKVNMSDAGKYKVLACNELGESSASISLNFDQSSRKQSANGDSASATNQQRPIFIEKPVIEQPNDQVVRFVCRLLARPEPTIEWLHSGEPVVSGTAYKVVPLKLLQSSVAAPATADPTVASQLTDKWEAALELYNVTGTMGGEYRCVARNTNGQAHASIALNVDAASSATGGKTRASSGRAPKFARKPTIRQSSGGRLVLECWLEARPEPTIAWFHGTRPVHDDVRHRITRQGPLTEREAAARRQEPTVGCDASERYIYVLSLELSSASLEDAGSYRCNAVNSLGESNANISLNFQGDEQTQEEEEEGDDTNKENTQLKRKQQQKGQSETTSLNKQEEKGLRLLARPRIGIPTSVGVADLEAHVWSRTAPVTAVWTSATTGAMISDDTRHFRATVTKVNTSSARTLTTTTTPSSGHEYKLNLLVMQQVDAKQQQYVCHVSNPSGDKLQCNFTLSTESSQDNMDVDDDQETKTASDESLETPVSKKKRTSVTSSAPAQEPVFLSKPEIETTATGGLKIRCRVKNAVRVEWSRTTTGVSSKVLVEYETSRTRTMSARSNYDAPVRCRASAAPLVSGGGGGNQLGTRTDSSGATSEHELLFEMERVLGAEDAGTYRCRVTGASGTSASAAVSLNVGELMQPTFVVRPRVVRKTQRQILVECVVATSARAPQITWEKSNVALSATDSRHSMSVERVPGSTSTSLSTGADNKTQYAVRLAIDTSTGAGSYEGTYRVRARDASTQAESVSEPLVLRRLSQDSSGGNEGEEAEEQQRRISKKKHLKVDGDDDDDDYKRGEGHDTKDTTMKGANNDNDNGNGEGEGEEKKPAAKKKKIISVKRKKSSLAVGDDPSSTTTEGARDDNDSETTSQASTRRDSTLSTQSTASTRTKPRLSVTSTDGAAGTEVGAAAVDEDGAPVRISSRTGKPLKKRVSTKRSSQAQQSSSSGGTEQLAATTTTTDKEQSKEQQSQSQPPSVPSFSIEAPIEQRASEATGSSDKKLQSSTSATRQQQQQQDQQQQQQQQRQKLAQQEREQQEKQQQQRQQVQRGSYEGLRDQSGSPDSAQGGQQQQQPRKRSSVSPQITVGGNLTPEAILRERRSSLLSPTLDGGPLLPPGAPGTDRRPSIIVPDDNKLRPGEVAIDRRRRSSILAGDMRRPSSTSAAAAAAAAAEMNDALANKESTPLRPLPPGVSAQKPTIVDFQDSVSGTEGHTSYLTFGIEGVPVPTLRFFKGDTEIYEGGRYHIVTDGDTNTVHFCIRKSKAMDEARYKIVATNEHGQDQAYIQLFVSDESGMDFRAMLKHRQYAKWKRDQDDPAWGSLKGVEEERAAQIKEPKRADAFLKPLQNQRVKQGKDRVVKFECVFSKSGVKAKWFKNNKELAYTSSIGLGKRVHMSSHGDVHVLEIQAPHVDDAGKYTCQCLDTKCSAMLEVDEPAPVYKFTKLLPKASGQYLHRELVLECTCNSYKAQVEWSFIKSPIPGTPLPTNASRGANAIKPVRISPIETGDDGVVVLQRVDIGKYSFELDKFGKKILRVRDCQLDDTGDYICRIINNEVDEDNVDKSVTTQKAKKLDEITQCSVQISEKKFQIMKPLYSQRAIEDDKVVLECEVDEYDAPVRWYKREMGSTGEWQLIEDGPPSDKQADGSKKAKHKALEIQADGKKRRIVLRKCKCSDEAQYKCATNADETTCELFVEPANKWRTRLKDVTVVEEEPLVLECELMDRKPGQSMVWTRNGRDVGVYGGPNGTQTADERVTLRAMSTADIGTGSQMTIERAQLSDAGQWSVSCGARLKCSCQVQVLPAEQVPSIVGPAQQVIQAEVGKVCLVEIPYKVGGTRSSPVHAQVLRNGKPVDTSICDVIVKDDKIQLRWRNPQRADCDTYELVIGNAKGSSTGARLTLNVTGVPDAPQGPLTISDVFKDRCKLAWRAPADDGGSPVSHYIVERQESTPIGSTASSGTATGSSGRWQECAQVSAIDKATGTNLGVPGASIRDVRIEKLTPGKEYRFRVRAVNKKGPSEPLLGAQPIIAKDPYVAPGRPENLTVVNWDKDFAELEWLKPSNDGGAPIVEYLIECKDKYASDWVTVAHVPSDDVQTAEQQLDKLRKQSQQLQDDTANKDQTTSHQVLAAVKEQNKLNKQTADSNKVSAKVVDAQRLKEGANLQFRVRAVNRAGAGEPSQATKPVFLKARFVKPYIVGAPMANLVVKRGRPIKYEIEFKGEPAPAAVWHINGTELTTSSSARAGSMLDGRCTIETDNDANEDKIKSRKTIITIASSVRSDSGRYKLLLRNSVGQCVAEADVVVLACPTPPEGPLVVEEIRSDQMTIKWRKPRDSGGAPIEGYVIEKLNTDNNRWVPAGECGPNDESFTVHNLMKGKKYKFRVRAKNKEGESEQALETNEPILARDPYEEPGAPGTPVLVDWSSQHAKLEWTKPASDGGAPITGYIIEARIVSPSAIAAVAAGGGAGTWTPMAQVTTTGAPTGATDKVTGEVHGLLAGQKYLFRVKAVNAAGEGAPSEPSATLVAKERNLMPLINRNAMKAVRVKAGEPIKFNVDVQGEPAPQCLWSLDGQPLEGATSTPTATASKAAKLPKGTGTEIDNSKEYETHLSIKSATRANAGVYKLKATNASGTDEAEVEVVVLDKPAAPEGPLQVDNVRADSCTLSWKPPSDDGGSQLTNYVVEKREVGQGDWSKVSGCVMSPTCKVKHLTPGKRYEFRVVAENVYGTSAPLQTDHAVVAKSPYDTPGAPGKPDVLETSDNSITIGWRQPHNDGGAPIQGYVVEMKRAGDDEWVHVSGADLVTGNKFKVSKGLRKGDAVELRVRAVNEAGEGEPSQTSGVVRAAPPGRPLTLDDSLGGLRDVHVRVGDPFHLELSFNGYPPPTAIWSLNGVPLDKQLAQSSGSAPEASVTETTAQLKQRIARRADAGTYMVVLDNGVGAPLTSTCQVHVLGVPSAPQGPLAASNVTTDSCTLTWKPPADDGGAPISNYIVERLDVTPGVAGDTGAGAAVGGSAEAAWVKCSAFVRGTTYDLVGLQPDHKYKFRVWAENEIGVSPEPLLTERPVVAKWPFDVPGAPDAPQVVKSDEPGQCTLAWREPASDGGAKVTGYQLECRDKSAGNKDWQVYNSTVPISPKSIDDYLVENLQPGHDYEFRVRALNKAGASAPSRASSDVHARAPLSPPNKPRDLQLTDYDADHVDLEWREPLPASSSGADEDGKILSYIVEGRVLQPPLAGDGGAAGNDTDSHATGGWSQVAKVPASDGCKAHVTQVTENAVMEFRVRAVNRAGVGEPCAATRPLVVRARNVKPHLRGDGLANLVVKRGRPIKFEVEFSGEPEPEVVWMINGEVAHMAAPGRVQVQVSSTTSQDSASAASELGAGAGGAGLASTKAAISAHPIRKTTLIVSDSVRTDSGTYKLVLRNASGECAPECQVVVLDKPGRPEGPLHVEDIRSDQCTLKWRKPRDSGGAPIDGYVIEKLNLDTGRWQPAGECGPDDEQFTVGGLLKGKRYKFRVRAKNKEGEGEPLETNESHLIKDPFTTPSAPGQAQVVDFDGDLCELAWTEPVRDGGSPITGYVVEARPATSPASEWLPADLVTPAPTGATGTKPECKTTVCNLIKGQKYEFRVKAVNAAGEGEPGEASTVHLARERHLAPKLNKSKLKPIRVKVGDAIRVECDAIGEPTPVIEFQHNAAPAVPGITQPSDAATGEPDGQQSQTSVFEIKSAKRGDTGKIKVRATNANGVDEAEVEVIVLDRPGVPQGPLQVDDVRAESCTLSWKPPNDDGGSQLTNYVVEKREVGQGEWSKVSGCVMSPTCKVKHLSPGKRYEFRVMAENLYGVSEPLQTDHAVLAKSPYNVPGAPGAPEPIETTDNSITIGWQKPRDDGGAPITSYLVQKRRKRKAKRATPAAGAGNDDSKDDDGGDDWTDVGEARGPDATSLKVGKLASGDEYEFRVAAINEAGQGAFSGASGAIKAQPAPSAPKIDASFQLKDVVVREGQPFELCVPFAGGHPQVNAEWTLNGQPISGDNAADRRVQTNIDLDAGGVCVLRNSSAVRGTDTGHYVLRLSNALGSDSCSCRVQVVAPPASPQEPLQVSDCTPESCSLAWRAPRDDGGAPVTNYVVERLDVTGGVPPSSSLDDARWTKCSAFVKGTQYEVLGLEPQHAYLFRVRAENQYGTSAPLETPRDAPVVAKFPFDVPSAPGAPRIDDYDATSVRLSWTPPSSDGGAKLQGYRLEVRDLSASDMTGAEGGWLPVAGTDAFNLVKDTEFKCTNLMAGHEYEFRVRAKNAAGLSAPSRSSGPHLSRSRYAPPSAPQNLRVTKVGKTYVDLKWDKPVADGGTKLTGYAIERKEASSSYWIKVNDFGCLEREYTCYNLTEWAEYEFRVCAINDAGRSEWCTTTHPVKVQEFGDGARAPEIVRKLVDKSVNLGADKLEIKCEALGKPLAQVRWLKNGRDLVSPDGTVVGGHAHNKYRTYCDEERGIFGLTILGPMEHGDDADYTCELRNPLGSDRTTCHVHVGAAPVITRTPTNATVGVGQNGKFKVHFSAGQFPVSVKLERQAGEHSTWTTLSEDGGSGTGAKYTVFDDYVTLYIGQARVDTDDAQYRVTVSNKSGSDTCTFPVRVTHVPGACGGPLQVSDMDAHSLLMSWRAPLEDGGAKVIHYVVERRELPSTDGAVGDEQSAGIKTAGVADSDWVIVSANCRDTSCKVSALTTGARYELRVRACNENGLSAPLVSDAPVLVRAPFDVPEAPGAPRVTRVGANCATLEWNKPTNDGGARITSYSLEKRELGTDAWQRVTPIVSGTTTSATVTNLIDERRYEFRVRACNAAGASDPSAASAGVLIRDPDAPGAPVFVRPLQRTVAQDGRTVELVVECSGQPTPHVVWYRGARELRDTSLKYDIVQSPGESATSSSPSSATAGTYVHKLIIKKCSVDDEDEYSVRATNKAGARTTRAELVVHTAPRIHLPARYQAPADLSSATQTVSGDEKKMGVAQFERSQAGVLRVQVHGKPRARVTWWRTNAETGVDEQIESGAHFDISSSADGTHAHTASLTIRDASRLDAGTYKVRAANDYGTDECCITVGVSDVPEAPRALCAVHEARPTAATSGAAAEQQQQLDGQSNEQDDDEVGCVHLSWQAPAWDGGSQVTNYVVEKRELGMSTWMRVGASRVPTMRVTSGVHANSEYEWRVSAENIYGRSEPSSVARCAIGGGAAGRTAATARKKRQQTWPLDADGQRQRCLPQVQEEASRLSDADYDRIVTADQVPAAHTVELQRGPIDDKYEILEELGRGDYGVTHRVRERATGHIYMAKFVTGASSPEAKALLRQELDTINALQAPGHRNLLKLHDAFEHPDEFVFVHEFCAGPEVLNTITGSGYSIPESLVRHYMRQVCDAVRHMHERNVVHLDLRPEALILNRKQGGGSEGEASRADVKLADFSLACRLDPHQMCKISARAEDFAAPEVMAREPVGFYTDMWAVGALAHVLLSGKSPFSGSAALVAPDIEYEPGRTLPEHVSQEARDFLEHLLVKQKEKRMTAHECLAHPWLADDDHSTQTGAGADLSAQAAAMRARATGDPRAWDRARPAGAGHLSNYSSLRKLVGAHSTSASPVPSAAEFAGGPLSSTRGGKMHEVLLDRREAAPRFVIKPPTATFAYEGQAARLMCAVASSTPCQVSWWRDHKELRQSVKYMKRRDYSAAWHQRTEPYAFCINRCKLTDRGEYIIRAENQYGFREEPVFVNVHPHPITATTPTLGGPHVDQTHDSAGAKRKLPVYKPINDEEPDCAPVFNFALRPRIIQTGHSVKLLCCLRAKPAPQITWTKDGQELNKRDYTMQHADGVCTLEIACCAPRHSGQYTCRAVNALGEASTTAQVRVDERPTVAPSVMIDRRRGGTPPPIFYKSLANYAALDSHSPSPSAAAAATTTSNLLSTTNTATSSSSSSYDRELRPPSTTPIKHTSFQASTSSSYTTRASRHARASPVRTMSNYGRSHSSMASRGLARYDYTTAVGQVSGMSTARPPATSSLYKRYDPETGANIYVRSPSPASAASASASATSRVTNKQRLGDNYTDTDRNESSAYSERTTKRQEQEQEPDEQSPSFLCPLPASRDAGEGMRLLLSASLSSTDVPVDITWTKDGRPLTTGGPVELKFVAGVASLTVSPLQYPQHEGLYECRASTATSHSATTQCRVTIARDTPESRLQPALVELPTVPATAITTTAPDDVTTTPDKQPSPVKKTISKKKKVSVKRPTTKATPSDTATIDG